MRRQLRVTLTGAVQGVGFRPFVYRLARALALDGWVLNGPKGVQVSVDGEEKVLREFLARLRAECPPPARIASLAARWGRAGAARGFAILRSASDSAPSAEVLPDLATCPDCLREIRAPGERRRGYPFTNCTRCGPRFTIVTGIPYDRPNTTMKGFPLCADCAREYGDPADRRFHAQPVACPACGPALWLEEGGRRTAQREVALEGAARAIERGRILALKGIGGYLLLCDARSPEAVRRLRERKRRQEKPFAVLFPDLAALRRACRVGKLEADALRSSAAPVVLLLKRGDGGLAPEVAPENARLGAMLPYAPLHHLLMSRLGFPVVATSGNLAEEPMATTEEEARARLAGVADLFLMHDRPIARHADDSVVRLSGRELTLLRRARGYAPAPLRVPGAVRRVLALGAHLKNTVSIAFDGLIVPSQHIGDLEAGPAYDAFRRAVDDLKALYRFEPEAAACDLHPDYLSSRYAERLGLPLVRVQHHHAHVAALMAEHGLRGPLLGVAFDGLGLGTDGTLWGGEFLRVDAAGFRRLAHLRPFPLPGGERAVREGRRAALGLLHEAGLPLERLRPLFTEDWEALRRLPASPAFSPRSSSVGRLFDAAAALAGLRPVNAFEGQAAMAFEAALGARPAHGAYPWALVPGKPLVADWAPMLAALLEDADRGRGAAVVSARFHNGLADLVVDVVRRCGLERVGLTGGVFQNAYLLERTRTLLERAGFQVFTHRRLPCNDGGVSAGQAYAACLQAPAERPQRREPHVSRGPR